MGGYVFSLESLYSRNVFELEAEGCSENTIKFIKEILVLYKLKSKMIFIFTLLDFVQSDESKERENSWKIQNSDIPKMHLKGCCNIFHWKSNQQVAKIFCYLPLFFSAFFKFRIRIDQDQCEKRDRMMES